MSRHVEIESIIEENTLILINTVPVSYKVNNLDIYERSNHKVTVTDVYMCLENARYEIRKDRSLDERGYIFDCTRKYDNPDYYIDYTFESYVIKSDAIYRLPSYEKVRDLLPEEIMLNFVRYKDYGVNIKEV